MNLATRFSYGRTNSTHNGALSARGLGAVLDETQLREYVPSIFAEQAHESRSARYGYIPTIEVVRGLEREGFKPVFACEAKARDESKNGYTKHMIRFRREALGAGTAIKALDDRSCTALGSVPELVMVNSHDGSTSYQLLAGFFRFICANGMICGDGFGEIRVQHKGDVVRDVIEGAYSVVNDFGRAIDSAENMRAIPLREEARGAFAESALALKYYDEEEGRTVAPIEARQLLIPARYEDKANDLWTTFNTVQENLIRGGLRGRSVDANGRRRRVTTRAVKGIDGNVRLNRALWTLTEQMAKLSGSTAVAA